MLKSIEDFIPSRNEFLTTLTTLSQYGDTASYGPRLHRFFESLIPYLSRPPEVTQWNESDFDNFQFIIHELFLYAITVMLRGEHFEAVLQLLSRPYYVPANTSLGMKSTVTYGIFRNQLITLERRNQRLKLNRLSLRADLLEQRSKTIGIPFQQVMQADFICFLRADLVHEDYYDNWYPETLLYASRHHGSFELFARSISKSYLGKVLPLLGVTSLVEVKAKLDEYAVDRNRIPRWNFTSFSPTGLLGFDQLGKLA